MRAGFFFAAIALPAYFALADPDKFSPTFLGAAALFCTCAGFLSSGDPDTGDDDDDDPHHPARGSTDPMAPLRKVLRQLTDRSRMDKIRAHA